DGGGERDQPVEAVRAVLPKLAAISLVPLGRSPRADGERGGEQVVTLSRFPLRVWGPIGILAWAALLRIAAFTGPSQWDDFAYLEFARDWVDGRYDPSRLVYVYGVRYGLILPVAGSMSLFGTAPWAVALPGFIASMLGVWCGMRVGR